MSAFSEAATVSVFVMVIGVNVLGLGWYRQFLDRLREEHPKTWEGLNRPRVHAQDGDEPGDWPALGYIFFGGYHELPDAEIRSLGNSLRFCLFTTIACVIALPMLLTASGA